MQDNKNKDKILIYKDALGKVFSKLRETNNNISLNQLGLQYDIDKGSLSKLERGIYDCQMSTAWKLAEANGVKFSQLAKMLEDELGEDFTFIDV